MEKRKNIVSFSGGKDSTAMLIMLLKNNVTIDEIIFIDTGAEFPEMYKHIELVEKNCNIEITTLKYPNTFEHYMLDHVKQKGKAIGSKGYGWCGGLCRWGTALKKQTFERYIREKYNNNIIEFQGIAFDEKQRLEKNQDKKWTVRYPLAESEIIESQALKFCYSLGYDWGGLYKNLDRVSCWCCRNKNLKELKNIFYYMPGTWQQLKILEQKIGEPYRKYKKIIGYENEEPIYKSFYISIADFERRFKKEGLQLKF